MKTLFISDLHLSASHPEISSLFLRFLEKYHPKHHVHAPIQALYILGDLFEAWIGDDTSDPHDQQIIEALHQYTQQGTPVYFMHGNRDFLIGQGFAQKTQCQLLADPTVINLYGQRILLMHGDRLCTLDTHYQWFRTIVQSAIIKRLFLQLPFSWRRCLVQKIRAFSQSLKHRQTQGNRPKKKFLSSEKYDASPMAIQQQLQTHQAQLLIHGHTHKCGIHTLTLNTQTVHRIVLGDWGITGSVLIIDNNSARLETIENS